MKVINIVTRQFVKFISLLVLLTGCADKDIVYTDYLSPTPVTRIYWTDVDDALVKLGFDGYMIYDMDSRHMPTTYGEVKRRTEWIKDIEYSRVFMCGQFAIKWLYQWLGSDLAVGIVFVETDETYGHWLGWWMEEDKQLYFYDPQRGKGFNPLWIEKIDLVIYF
jgi:hypothetical protein